MDEKCINYKKTCFKNPERIFKTFFHCVPGNMEVIWVISEGFINKEKIVFWKAIGRTLERMKELDRWIGQRGGGEIINSADDIPDIEEKQGKRNFNDIATFKGEWLEGKFVNSNVINLSRRSLSKSEISLLS